ncbi:hypothetical protein AAFF_G00412640 [Aldrovandia affinis]|uniref:Uncharacterized protein n=1 Tax=Aldrovandia affinis TaxID=143900 RepID=A0AAD7SAW6_9TELE|nr:hypothetical protein AAFF_G00412640 [Aldrovandia affinis]
MSPTQSAHVSGQRPTRSASLCEELQLRPRSPLRAPLLSNERSFTRPPFPPGSEPRCLAYGEINPASLESRSPWRPQRERGAALARRDAPGAQGRWGQRPRGRRPTWYATNPPGLVLQSRVPG